MKLVRLLFMPTGRTGRRDFWLGLGLWPLAGIALFLVKTFIGLLGELAGLDLRPFLTGLEPWQRAVFAWWMYCVFSKRLHDLGLFAGWLAAPVVLSVVTALTLAGIFGGQDAMGVGVLMVLAILVIVLGFALLVGLRRGAPKENRFGPPPGAEPPPDIDETFS
jgi:uncharacterized membrane protein YhaH (DUF805 family)